MANFLKVGQQVINLDNVQVIELDRRTQAGQPRVRVYFDFGNIEDNEVVISFTGQDAEVLRAWIKRVAIDAADIIEDR